MWRGDFFPSEVIESLRLEKNFKIIQVHNQYSEFGDKQFS